ncbi:hypothetical protein [Streptomyces glaucescens]|uniref:hypothetical protein n=1 Tax=Streptomyces glaucescens TaxID=1907 RepID=UPI00117EFEB0|nr:hypothetical protein [Streptomyces glaucescens]
MDVQERFEPGCGTEIADAHVLIRLAVRVLDPVEASVVEHQHVGVLEEHFGAHAEVVVVTVAGQLPMVTSSIVFNLAVGRVTNSEMKNKFLGRAGGLGPLPAFEVTGEVVSGSGEPTAPLEERISSITPSPLLRADQRRS